MNKNNNKIKILVALSGGVDSAVAAALLVKAGYNVTGAFMINYRPTLSELRPTSSGIINPESCYIRDYRDAVRVAAKLNIKILKLNFVKEYKRDVLDYMFAEYKKGRTPNPDVMCNKFVKFGSWLKKAESLGFDYLATGHYARIAPDPTLALPFAKGRGIVVPPPPQRRGQGEVSLLEAKDKNKDQTYFLHQLNKKQLSKTMFPVGDYTKPEVRKLAEKFGLPVANKEESMGICFIGEVPMKEFLEAKIKHKPGKIFLSNGKEIGRHDGLAFYTIGQRHSLPLLSKEGLGEVAVRVEKRNRRQTPPNLPLVRGGGDSRPLYVVKKDIKKNRLIVGFDDDPLLFKKQIELEKVNWVSGQKPKFPLKCLVRFRHRQELIKCVVRCHSERGRRPTRNLVTVHFEKPERAVTPGQFAVLYKNGECLGGGAIM